jgi:heme-degrading monooxygenase HmoA
MIGPAQTPAPPYFAVIFTSIRNEEPGDGFTETDMHLYEVAQGRPGYLGYESVGEDGLGITVSYWESEAAIAAWKAVADHRAAQQQGRASWFDRYDVRVARVERAYSFTRDEP